MWAGNILNAPTNGILCNTELDYTICMEKNLQYIKGKTANHKIAYTIFKKKYRETPI